MKRAIIRAVAAFVLIGSQPMAEDFPAAGAITPGHPNLPNGYELTAHFVCGAGLDRVEDKGIVIALTRGVQRPCAGDTEFLPGEAFDRERVEFQISGLEPDNEYVIGFTWWDCDQAGRRQSVEYGVGSPVVWRVALPAAVPLAFHGDQPTFARIQLPVPASAATDGHMSVAFVNDSGPDTVLNEVWLMRRSQATSKKRVVIVTGDDWTGHHWRATGPELAGILREDPRLEVLIVESPAVFASPWMDHFDAAVIHFKDYANRLPIAGNVWKGLERYVAVGHGLVIVHFGCGAFQEWRGYARVAGRIWDPQKRGHDPYGRFRVRVVDASHPISSGMSAFETDDELYTCLVGDLPIRVLWAATSVIDGLEHPMGFVVPEGPGRVFHSPLGHDVNALRSPGTRELYRRAGAWAAGLEPGGK